MGFKDVTCGEVTILVNVPGLPLTTGFTLLSLTGTIIGETEFSRHHDEFPPIIFPKKIEVQGEVTEEEEFLLVRVTDAVLPNGFPLSKTQLLTDIAINIDYIIMLLPVAVTSAISRLKT